MSGVEFYYHSTPANCFFNAQIKPHIHSVSVVWDGCSDVLRRRLDALHGRTLMLIFPDTILTAGQKLKEMRIMSLHKQLEYKLVCSCTRSLTMRPQSIYI